MHPPVRFSYCSCSLNPYAHEPKGESHVQHVTTHFRKQDCQNMYHILLITQFSPIWGGANIGFELVKWTGRLHKKLPPIASFGTRVSPTIKRRN